MNYKDTLNLPRTDFPMKANLTHREPEILKRWHETGLYQLLQEQRASAPLFVLHDGPPFANGDVHMGTALNKILKDIIVRSRSMAGFRAPYVPGWDCHGLPIEFRVVKESRGLSPLQVRERSEAYARKYVEIQKQQFQRLGIAGDWEHPYLTLDPTYEASILEVFAELVERDLVYQSKKPVYWSTGAQTALAEAEIEYQDRDDPAIYVAFRLQGALSDCSIAIWTTTPWTLPANVGVAVNPRFRYVAQPFRRAGRSQTLILAQERVTAFSEESGWETAGPPQRHFSGGELENLAYEHPFLGRTGKIVLGDFVTLDAGTGCVHMAPGHGQDDYQVGLKYGLPVVAPVDDLGRFTEEAEVPEWTGLYVFDANPLIIEKLEQTGALLASSIYHHSYPHCWRSKTPIVFRAVEQFFIRIDAIRTAALEAIDQVGWIPAWSRNRMHATVAARPDWCISRQRSWGVPLPVFYQDGKAVLRPDWIRKIADLVKEAGSNSWYNLDDDALAQRVGLPAGLTRRNDTLDVWIDSGVSHRAVLKARSELRWPADVYVEATDQHRGWFQSSLLSAIAVDHEAPYKTVITHAFVVDSDSREKISKSQQGTYAKPTEVDHYVRKYGADIVRLWVASVNFSDEVPFGEKLFDHLTDAYRRIRNTLRVLLGNVAGFDPERDATRVLTMIDTWLLGRLVAVIEQCREAFEKYEFHRVFQVINQFCTVELSSLYIDISKDRLYCDPVDQPRRRATQTVMQDVLDVLVRLLGPILVFTSEEAWGYLHRDGSPHLELFPDASPYLAQLDAEQDANVEALLKARAIVSHQLESARQQKLISNNLEAEVHLLLPSDNRLHRLPLAEIEEFLILSHLELGTTSEGSGSATVKKTPRLKCERCWRHREMVGQIAAHPTLCERCAPAVDRLRPA